MNEDRDIEDGTGVQSNYVFSHLSCMAEQMQMKIWEERERSRKSEKEGLTGPENPQCCHPRTNLGLDSHYSALVYAFQSLYTFKKHPNQSFNTTKTFILLPPFTLDLRALRPPSLLDHLQPRLPVFDYLSLSFA